MVVVGLIATVVILFGLQGQVILDRPQVIALIAVPILIQSYGIFALAYAAACGCASRTASRRPAR